MAEKRTKTPSSRGAGAPRRPRTSRQKALLAASVLAGKKAERPVVLDLRKLTLIADYFVVCHGTSDVHVRALAKELGEQLEARGLAHAAPQGGADGRWVLFDLGDVIVHIFGDFERGFYDLERLWGDARVVEVP